MAADDVQFHPARQEIPEENFDEVEDPVGLLVGDKAEGEFGRSDCGQHGFRPGALVPAGQSVDFRRGPQADAFGRGVSFFASERGSTRLAQIIVVGHRQFGHRGTLRRIGRNHIVVETGHGHASVMVVQAREHADECGGGIDDCAAEDSRMQVGGGAAQNNFHRGDTAQTLRQGRIVFRYHPRVRDGHHVAAQFAAARADEIVEIGAPDLFLAFDEEDEVDRQRSFLLQQVDRAKDVGENLSFVVRCAACEDTAVADGGLERGRSPLADRVLRLHVIVAVNKNRRFSRCFGPAGQHCRVSAGLRDLGIEAVRRKQMTQPLRALPHLRCLLRLGGDATEPQKFDQQIEIGPAGNREVCRGLSVHVLGIVGARP